MMNRAMLSSVLRFGSFLLLSGVAFAACKRPSAPVSQGMVPPESAAGEHGASRDNDEKDAPVSGVEGDPDGVPDDPAPATGGAGSAALLAEATRVLRSMSGTRYSHHTHIAGGEYDVDCSGFVDYLLTSVNPPALAELRAQSGVKRPLAKHFVLVLDSAVAKQHLSRVARIQDLGPGDLIAWDLPADVRSTNTGHVMLVASMPEQLSGKRWSVPIIDSSASPHGLHDARHTDNTTGIGSGTIVLEVGADGAPVAYHWSPAKSSPRHETSIVFGRAL